jgi:uncharacterized protein YchJ
MSFGGERMSEMSRGANRTNFVVTGEDGEPVTVTIKRNDICFCGSGKKFKRCCMLVEEIASDEG